MPYHIPFEQRRRGAPIYIGFEALPTRPRRPFNGWGLASFAILGLSVGALAPLSFLVGLIGMRKQPRTLATFSTVVSGLITALMALGIAGAVHHAQQRHARFESARTARRNAEMSAATQILLKRAEEDFDDFALDHDGQLPGQYDGMMLAVQHRDAWKNDLRYDIDSGKCLLRSAGPDQRFDSRDDVTLELGLATAEASFGSASQIVAEPVAAGKAGAEVEANEPTGENSSDKSN